MDHSRQESKNLCRQDHRRSFLRTALVGSSLAGWQLLTPNQTLTSANAAYNLPTTPGRLKRIRDIQIYRSEDDYCGPSCSPVVFSDGEILVGFRRAHSSGHMNLDTETCLTSSTDAGQTWTEPLVIDFGGVHNINLTLLSDGTLLYATSIVQPITKGAYERAKDRLQNFMADGRRRLVFSSPGLGQGDDREVGPGVLCPRDGCLCATLRRSRQNVEPPLLGLAGTGGACVGARLPRPIGTS